MWFSRPALMARRRAGELVREHRGDGHLAACVAAGLGTVQANVFTELWLGYSLGEYTSTRGFGTDRIAASLGSITDWNGSSVRPRRSPRPCWWPMRSRPTLANGPPGRAAIVRGVSRLVPHR